ncbi:hypothetical protein [Microbacterium foliorum]|uniref:Uncharacterized protein n=1 Tax=Microbacterium foliorum TaxID=104336 RepID=A0A0F0KWU5_9MICO|nr:hypothetical protein [Microbacterium foliorum]KJL23706.1 hypothetical protein RN50_01046 [Microbacterium foliorum]
MPEELPGKLSPSIPVALTKVALRLIGASDLADAIGDLTGLGRTSIDSLVRTAKTQIADRASAEFTAVGDADREWAESMLSRTYVRLAADPARPVMSESLIGAEAVARLAGAATSVEDLRVLDSSSDDVQAYVTAVSEAIAYLISQWYSTNEEPNRAAMSQVAGETLQTVRGLQAHLDAVIAPAMRQLQQSTAPAEEQASQGEQFIFELDADLQLRASEDELADLVQAAVVAVYEERPFRVQVTLPILDDQLKDIDDVMVASQIRRQYRAKARRAELALSAFFSAQVESVWVAYLRSVSDRLVVVRAIVAGQVPAGSKLDVWRTEPPIASAPVWLTPDEITAVVESTRLGEWNHLRGGAGWRAADELPPSVIREKVMPSILAELVRREVTTNEGWDAEAALLPHWHIGQG